MRQQQAWDERDRRWTSSEIDRLRRRRAGMVPGSLDEDDARTEIVDLVRRGERPVDRRRPGPGTAA